MSETLSIDNANIGTISTNCTTTGILSSTWATPPTYIYNPNITVYKAENGFIVVKEGKTYIVTDKKELVQYF